MMGKRAVMALLLTAWCGAASAQSWTERLKSAVGSLWSASEKPAVEVEAPVFPAAAELTGTWNFGESAVEYRGDDMLAGMAVRALGTQLGGYYAKAGLQPGVQVLTVGAEGEFRASVDGKQIVGRYDYAEATGGLTLHVVLQGRELAFAAEVRMTEGALTLLVDAAAALAEWQRVFPESATSTQMQQVSAVMAQVPGVMVGAVLRR